MIRLMALVIALVLAGCGTSPPPTDMPARTWKYYVANPVEIGPMQKVCRQWSESTAAVGTQPAVVAGNCRAAAYAQAHLKWQK